MLAGGEGERGDGHATHNVSEPTLLRPHHAPYDPAPTAWPRPLEALSLAPGGSGPALSPPPRP